MTQGTPILHADSISMDRECRRMGNAMVEELGRYLAGEPLRWQITRDGLAVMA